MSAGTAEQGAACAAVVAVAVQGSRLETSVVAHPVVGSSRPPLISSCVCCVEQTNRMIYMCENIWKYY
eukprot:SAG11_NODE_2536_length_3245_cov_3.417673_2_plen_68_part_00